MRQRAFFARSGLLVAALAVGATTPAHAQPSEAAVKAAFLPKFTRYVTWPPAAAPDGAPFQLCIIGADPYGRAVDAAAATEGAGPHRVVVRRLATADGSGGCHLAFVQGTAAQSTGQMLSALHGRPVLTITDARGGNQRGMIHFTVHEGRVRFYIDDARAAQSNLSISSRLLALALGVRQRRG